MGPNHSDRVRSSKLSFFNKISVLHYSIDNADHCESKYFPIKCEENAQMSECGAGGTLLGHNLRLSFIDLDAVFINKTYFDKNVYNSC